MSDGDGNKFLDLSKPEFNIFDKGDALTLLGRMVFFFPKTGFGPADACC